MKQIRIKAIIDALKKLDGECEVLSIQIHCPKINSMSIYYHDKNQSLCQRIVHYPRETIEDKILLDRVGNKHISVVRKPHHLGNSLDPASLRHMNRQKHSDEEGDEA